MLAAATILALCGVALAQRDWQMRTPEERILEAIAEARAEVGVDALERRPALDAAALI